MNKKHWSDQEKEYLLQLIKEHPGLTNFQYAEMLMDKYDRKFTEDAVRKQRRKFTPVSTGDKKEFVADFKINSDGSHSVTKVMELSDAQMKNHAFLLDAHGYDPNEWEIVEASSSIWNQHNKQDGTLTLYASKIKAKPKVKGFHISDLLKVIKETKPTAVKIDKLDIKEKRLLEVPLFDAHFGISDLEYYKETQAKIYELLSSKHWEEVLFVVGQDMLHTDNFRGQTANGTQIEQVDLVKAWNDCKAFYEILIEKAIKQSRSVKVMYAKGNHDESMSWAFTQLLKEKYPQITVDDEMKERKAHSFNSVFIGVTHGDKARKNLHNIFPIEFPMEWAKAKVKEIHTGHLHVQEDKDVFGMMVRTLATRNKTDKWHKDNGFVGAHKRFMLFEYSEEALESIHYV